MKSLCFANAKGGTGKTTMAAHVAVGLALHHLAKVVVLDLDFQANVTKWLLDIPERPAADAPGLPHVLRTGEVRPIDIQSSPLYPNLWVLPATDGLQAAEFQVANTPAGQTHLRTALRSLKDRFDYAVLDCAPSMGIAVVAGLCAADAVFVPVLPGFLSLSGLADLEATLQRLRTGFNVRTRVRGYALFNVDTRVRAGVDTRQLLLKHTNGKLMASEIRTSTAATYLPGNHRTAFDAGADGRGAEDYAALVDEVVGRIAQKE